MGVIPSGAEDTYSFDVDIELEPGQERLLDIAAWDMAGNMTRQEMILRMNAELSMR